MSSDARDGQTLVGQVDRRLGLAGFLANGLGGLILVVFLIFLFPTVLDENEVERLQIRSAIAAAALLAVTLPLGRIWSHRGFLAVVGWLRDGREARREEQEEVLRYPLRFSLVAGLFWFIGSITGWFLGLDFGLMVAETLMVAVALGGLSACALQYLLVERLMRPITARALAGGEPPQTPSPGVAARLTIAWVLATGVPLLGTLAIALWEVLGDSISPGEIVGPVIFLTALAFVLGLFAIRIAAGSVADPLASMRGSLRRVEAGDFSSRARVDDGSEVGQLQAGFNRMVAGLDERERLREAFGAYVDPDLAERVLREGIDLAGEQVEVSVLFLDVRDFTTFSERSHAREVVARLNELYGEVVPVISKHKGHANKFIGDGLLAVFGAPDKLDDHAERAVAAAREIAELVRSRFGDDLRVGLGVNSGPVMAGSIGGGGRLDFTVIGDTVNTAARVESATRETGDDLLITDATLRQLAEGEGAWIERFGFTLKGKTREVSLYAPAKTAAGVP